MFTEIPDYHISISSCYDLYISELSTALLWTTKTISTSVDALDEILSLSRKRSNTCVLSLTNNRLTPQVIPDSPEGPYTIHYIVPHPASYPMCAFSFHSFSEYWFCLLSNVVVAFRISVAHRVGELQWCGGEVVVGRRREIPHLCFTLNAATTPRAYAASFTSL